MKRAAARRIPPEVVLLGVASFLNDVSSDIIFPLLPIFLTVQLGASATALGVIEGAADAVSSIFKLIAGAWSDRLPRRKPLVVGGYALAGLARLGIPFAAQWATVFAARVLDRAGKGIRSAPRDALIADVTPREDRGRAFGLHRAFDHAGAIAGPVLAALMVGPLHLPLRQIFLLAGIPSVLAVLLLVVRLREEPRAIDAPQDPLHQSARGLPRVFWRSMAGIALFSLANASDAFLILQAYAAGVNPGTIALLWAAHHGVKVLLSTRAGALSDRVDRRHLLVSGWLLYAAVYLMFPLVENLFLFLTLLMLYAVPFALTEGAERAWISDPIPPGLRGKAFGVYYLTVGLCTLLGTVMFGAIYEHAGKIRAFHLAAGFAVAATIVVAIQKKRPEDEVDGRSSLDGRG
jgi:MFS family permease